MIFRLLPGTELSPVPSERLGSFYSIDFKTRLSPGSLIIIDVRKRSLFWVRRGGRLGSEGHGGKDGQQEGRPILGAECG